MAISDFERELMHSGLTRPLSNVLSKNIEVEHIVRVELFGAVGDGVTDDTIAIQRAWDAVPTGGTLVYNPKYVYKTTSITCTKSITVDFNNTALIVAPFIGTNVGQPAFNFYGSKTVYNATSVSGQDVTLTTVGDAVNFAVGDMVFLRDTSPIYAWFDYNQDGTSDEPNYTTATFQMHRELNKVKSIAGGVITLELPVSRVYTTGIKLDKVSPISPVVKNVGNVYSADIGQSYTGGFDQEIYHAPPNIFNFRLCETPKFLGGAKTVFDGSHVCHICFSACLNPYADSAHFKNAYYFLLGGLGYGLQFSDCRNGLAQRLIGNNLRHFTDYNHSINCGIQLSVAYNVPVMAYSTHGTGSIGCWYDRTEAYGCVAGWQVGNSFFRADYGISITRSIGRNISQQGIVIITGAEDTVIENCDISGPPEVVHISTGATRTIIRGCILQSKGETGNNVISAQPKLQTSDIAVSSTIDLTVENTKLLGGLGQDIYADFTGTLIINGNRTNASYVQMIISQTLRGTHLYIENNMCEPASITRMIQVGTSSVLDNLAPTGKYHICNNKCLFSTSSSALISGSNSLKLTNNSFRNNSSAILIGGYLPGWLTNGAQIMGNTPDSFDYPSISKKFIVNAGDANRTANGNTGTIVYKLPITADRTVTASTQAINGDTIKVIRTAAATGAFNVICPGGKTLSPGQWAILVWDAIAWQTESFGSL